MIFKEGVPASEATDLVVTLEFTPNPNTLKYAVNRILSPHRSVTFNTVQEAGVSPLALQLLEIKGVGSVFFGRDFITLTKTEEGDWSAVHRHAMGVIQNYLSFQRSLFVEGYEQEKNQSSGQASGSELMIAKIQEILDQEIRPAVAMDGGDIVFDRYEDGIVYLDLQGSCRGCPSSTATLKLGVESRLKELIPEVREVVAV